MSGVQAPPLSTSGATLEFLKELVASSIESDDVAPLVKAVFEVAPAGEPLPVTLMRDSESATASQGELSAGAQVPQGSVLDSVLELLQEVAEEKEAEIQQICRANASEIAGAMHELGTMQRSTAMLRQQLLANNTMLQVAGTSLAGRLEELQDVLALQHKVEGARKAVSVALQVLLLCARAARYIEGKQLYKAFKTLEAIQRDHGPLLRGRGGGYLPLLPSSGSGGMGTASREGTLLKLVAGSAVAAATGGGGGVDGSGDVGTAEQLGPLAAFLRKRVAELVVLVEQRAVADFNNWLANMRAQARTIGMRAIRWAAAERQQEEALTRQRKLLLPRLEGLQDVHEAGVLVAQSLRSLGLHQVPPGTPLPLPGANIGTPGTGGNAAAAAAPDDGTLVAGGSSLAAKSSSTSSSAIAARFAAFKAARQAAGMPPTHTPHSLATGGASASASAEGAAAAPSPGTSPPGTASSRAAAAAAAAAQMPALQQLRGFPRSDTFQVTGDLLEGVDMAPLHRCVHIHACLGRLPQFADYYAATRRQQLAADLVLHQGDFLGHYQAYLTQLAGFFLVEDAVQASAAGTAGEPLNIVAQVDASWDAAVAALKSVLEPAFRGATAAAAMLTVKDFMLLVCLALDHCGYQTVAVREVLMNSRAKYHDLLSAATTTTVKAAVSGDSLAVVEVPSPGRADELFGQLALPPTFHLKDAENKRPPFKAPFSSMVPELVRTIRGHIVDSVAYLKGLLTVGEVVPVARQYRDRMLARVVVGALQQRLDAAAGVRELPVGVGLQLVANVAALQHVLPALDDFLLAQARGETPETTGAAAAAASGSRSPSPGQRSHSCSQSPARQAGAAGGQKVAEEPRGRQQAQQGGSSADRAAAASRSASPRPRSLSRGSSHGSGPSPATAAASQQQASGSQQASHTVLSFAAAAGTVPSRPGGSPASSAAASGSAAAFHALLASAEALVVQAVAAKAAGLLAAGEQLDWAPGEQRRSTTYSPYIDELIMYLKECASMLKRAAPADSVERILPGFVRYVADAIMLQLMSDAIPTFNIFGLQRLFSDLGGLSRAVGSMGVPGLADELAEPLLFCELMVFGSLEDVLKPEQRAPGSRLAALDLRRLALVLDKYRELEKASGFSSMHKSKQAERFISRKTVDRVLKELREQSRSASRASSTSSSSLTLLGGGGGSFTGVAAAVGGGASRSSILNTKSR